MPSCTTHKISMDKAELIAKVARERSDQLLLARVLDKHQQMERRNIPAATGFLSPREQQLAQAVLRTAGVRDGFVWDGGYPEAERRLLLFLPDWAEGDGSQLVCLRAAFHGQDSSLTHRDILGSLMGLGVAREKLGDILVSPHSADIVAAASLGAFLLREWESAGRVKLTVTEIDRGELLAPQVQVREVRDTVPSLRLDAVTASAFSLSRSRAAELIAGGKVSLDHAVCMKGDKLVGQGSVLTVRGLGRAVVRQCDGLSRKGRVILAIDRYVG